MVSQEKHFNVLSKSEGLCAVADLRVKQNEPLTPHLDTSRV